MPYTGLQVRYAGNIKSQLALNLNTHTGAENAGKPQSAAQYSIGVNGGGGAQYRIAVLNCRRAGDEKPVSCVF